MGIKLLLNWMDALIKGAVIIAAVVLGGGAPQPPNPWDVDSPPDNGDDDRSTEE